ncbi:branched-chain amino acid ABC transporter permease [Nocardioides sp. LHD-245]|uniref:branched-chain amino acid ABC transporter permease n=1 Tax=Nocardioides sp. LHD-245 TaxID=3051387 RepID=UPI0027E1E208|nr:branched-chain amino acid ABC transporter permease [Nocardioides sp. LHD-245]
MPDLRNRPGLGVAPLVLGGTTALLMLGWAVGANAPETSVLSEFPQALVDGIKFGLIVATGAIGLSLIFGTTKMINFAHGELITLGAIVAWYFQSIGLPLWLAALVAVVAGAGFGGALELGLWRPLRKRRTGLFQLLIISLGLSLAVRHIYLIVFGGASKAYSAFRVQDSWNFWGVSMTPRDLGIMVTAVLVVSGTAWMIHSTPIGQAMRAVADNRDLAEASGISVKRVILVVWMMGSGLAAVGGVLLGLDGSVSWDMGFAILMVVFAAVILGGLGKSNGALVGALAIGLVSQLSTLFSPPELRIFWALLALMVVLLVRPQGILGSRNATRIG